jgi:thiol-disulfide isomerase/thioredoxin
MQTNDLSSVAVDTRLRAFLVLLLLIVFIHPVPASAQTQQKPAADFTYLQSVKASDFPKGLDWLNTERPLSLADLRGKVVVLDFWTYCCINCLHVLPKLHDLEVKYGDSLAVIGVHSAKFEDEGDTDNIRQAILRYDISHPVLNDHGFVVWKDYGVRAWPTMVLIDPEGYVVKTQSGESAPDVFDPIISKLLTAFSQQGKLDTTPLDVKLERDSAPRSVLSFPGKVHVEKNGHRLFISDSGNHRIVVADRRTGELEAVIGSGTAGLRDGDYKQARFNDPQGLTLAGDILYVADRKNHVLRAIDLKGQTVTTVAGTGEQGGYGRGTGPATGVALNSPWDVEFINGIVFIAMAGPHQIWYYDPSENLLGVWAGSGRENLTDGPRLLAALAQPSGLTTDHRKHLFFADAEVSAIRSAGLSEKSGVTTIIGQGLFDFGDIDGDRVQARMQHPLGVTWYNGALYVADTYNNKIKRVVPERYTSYTFAGTGEDGYTNGRLVEASFDEPSGLDAAVDGTLYIADTNNHLIRVIDPDEKTVSTFALKGLSNMPERPTLEPADNVKVLETATVQAGNGILRISPQFPFGYKLNEEGGMRIVVHGSEGSVQPLGDDFRTYQVPFNLAVTTEAGKGSVTFTAEYFYCREDNEGLCYIDSQTLKQPLVIMEDTVGDSSAIVKFEVPWP